MRRVVSTLALVAVLATVPVSADEILLPAFAWRVGGKAGNTWTTEVYLVNPGADVAHVRRGDALVGRMNRPDECLPIVAFWVDVPPRSSVLVPGSRLAVDLGCPDEFLGAIVLSSDLPIAVSSRMANLRGGEPGDDGPVAGFGQEIDGVPMAELPSAGTTWMLPSLAWHPGPCGAVRYETHLHFANPAEGELAVTLLPDGLARAALSLDGQTVALPHTLRVAGRSWRQLKLAPPLPAPDVCAQPEMFSLLFTLDGPAGVYASVVDRTTQDPRTVTPVAVAP